MRNRTSVAWIAGWLLLLLLTPTAGWTRPEASARPDSDSDTEAETPETSIERVYERLNILGDAENLEAIPGSAHRIGKEELERQRQSDVHRILRSIPGVSIQEEEGFGLRPNIGIRGTGVERSSKITLLEDGVLIAPAPYAAPSAYYAPSAGRMEGFEVRKGSASIRQGPYTNGGAVNYLSTSIPGEFGGRVDLSAGTDDLFKGHAYLGNSGSRWGWMLETFQMDHGGFKQLDGGGDTGFEVHDYVGKLRFNTGGDTRVYQALELKLGKTEQFGKETYLGLTEADFRNDPYRRYVGSAEDQIRTDHEQVQLRYFAALSAAVDFTATVYNNDFFRNWHKLEKVAGTNASTVLRDPAGFERELGILRGEIDSDGGELNVRNNRREYYARGVQAHLGFDLGQKIEHDLEIGVRYHEDEEDRFQEEDLFAVVDGRTELVAFGAPGSNANRIAQAKAVSFFVRDSFQLGSWTFAPGVRYENIDLERRDFGKLDPTRSGADLTLRENRVDVLIPGVGVIYETDAAGAFFVGAHRGFSPPGPGSTEEVDAEDAVNYELGHRFQSDRFATELVGFFNDYDNLLGSDTVSSGGTGNGDQFNGGAVELFGVEASLTFELAQTARLKLPVRLAYTYTDSEFKQTFETDFADWEPQVDAGDALPYIAPHQLNATVSALFEGVSVHADFSWVDEMRTSSGRGPIPVGEGIESRFLIDLGLNYEFRDVDFYAKIRNLTDEEYIASRRPAGLRPGLPQTLLLGVNFDF